MHPIILLFTRVPYASAAYKKTKNKNMDMAEWNRFRHAVLFVYIEILLIIKLYRKIIQLKDI